MKRFVFACIFMVCIFLTGISAVKAEDRVFNAEGDGTSWSDDNNWSPAIAPTIADDVLINMENGSVVCTQTFKARSVTIGGSWDSILTSDNFIFGAISPDSTSDIAVHNRKGGIFRLISVGTVILRGQYKDSQESPVAQPSFIFSTE